jgi:5,10-methylenetetrahydromethanopterin reductase
MASISVSFDGRATVDVFLAQLEAAEAAGAARVWIASHLFERDPFTLAAMALDATQRIDIALMAVSPYIVHSVQIAMAAATLCERHPGRLVLCLGTGVPRDVADAGVLQDRPLATMRDAIAVIGSLLRGEAVGGRRLATGAEAPPIYLAASGPRMLALAGACADGVVVSAGTSDGFVREALSRVDAGARGRTVHRAGLVYAAADADRLRGRLAMVLRGAHHRQNVASGGSVDEGLREPCLRHPNNCSNNSAT